MTIVLCGGGSGGHITPLVAVARELRKLEPDARIVFIGDRGGKFVDIVSKSGLFDEEYTVHTGKLRRYSGESWLRRLTDLRTILLNGKDIFKALHGIVQSSLILRELKPDAILFKGGSVCVPVGIAARLTRPKNIVTHDSDAVPGLSNRVAGSIANYHATGMPADNYRYPKEKICYVGLPIDERFRRYSESEQRFLKEKFGIKIPSQILLLTGGSQGARRLNQWTIEALPELLENHKDLYAVLVVGSGNIGQSDVKSLRRYSDRLRILDFTDELFHYSAIADVVISRAGATTMAEFANQRKACILVPNPDLTGSHQIHNGNIYKDASAAIVISENELKQGSYKILNEAINQLLNDKKKRQQLGENMYGMLPSKPAARAIAELLLSGKSD